MSVEIAGEARLAVTQSESWEVRVPERALLTFGVGVLWRGAGEAPGWGRFSVEVDGRDVARETQNPRVPPSWKDVTVELKGGGRPTRVTFHINLTDKDGRPIPKPDGMTLAVSEPVLHDVRAYGSAKGAILISIDTLRRDHVGAYGYSKPTTPTLDGWARAGVVAEDAVSVSSWTLPSHLSMLTSVLPGAHGGTNGHVKFNRAVPTVAEVLKKRGFATHAVTSHLYVSSVYGVDAGFDSMNYRQDRPASNVANHAMDLIDRFGDRPFFLFLHFYDPHWHYAPPAELLRLFEPVPYTGRMTGNLNDFQNKRPEEVKREDLEHLLALYDGEIHSVDNELARLAKHLEERGVSKNTLLFVTSDHGEEFLEHGSWEHQKTLYEEVIRVPMIVTGPGVTSRRESKPVSLIDVSPTILNFLGVETPPTMTGRSILAPLTESREQYGETEHTIDHDPIFFLRDGAKSWKVIQSVKARGAQWFDLAKDPGEKQDRPPRADVQSVLTARACDTFARTRSGTKPSETVRLSPEQVDQLRALNYVAAPSSGVFDRSGARVTCAGRGAVPAR